MIVSNDNMHLGICTDFTHNGTYLAHSGGLQLLCDGGWQGFSVEFGEKLIMDYSIALFLGNKACISFFYIPSVRYFSGCSSFV